MQVVKMMQMLFVRAWQGVYLHFPRLYLAAGTSTGLQSIEWVRMEETNRHRARFLRHNDYKSGNLPSAKDTRIDYRDLPRNSSRVRTLIARRTSQG